MANGYFERGEMYDILFGDGLGGEMNAHRPGIIVSSDRGNTSCHTVLMIYTTTTTTPNKQISINHEFVMNGWRNYALCNQFVTVNKSRLKKFYGKLSDFDMRAIDECLEEALDLGYIDETALKAKDEEIADRDVLIDDLKTELAGAIAEIAKRKEEIASLKMEIEMWQKCYGRCMDMLVDVKVSGDVARRTAVAAPVVPDIPKQPEEPKRPEPPVEESPVEEKRLDINTCTATALKKVGFSLAVARKIVGGRPFKSVEDLKRINGVKANLLRVLAPKLCCTEVIKPVVNADPGYEVDDSAETEVVAEIPQNMKVNVNTASAEELHEKLGLSKTVCFSITGTRKRDGLYKSIDELKNAKKFTQKHFEMYRDMLEV